MTVMAGPEDVKCAEPGRKRATSKKTATPMVAQYLEIKAANPDGLLFYRMGDFYELFFEDAELASRVLGIALTKRGKHLGNDIAMCGVPVHSARDYLSRLVKLGHRVTICEQTEDPAVARKRGSRTLVRREVVRVVTPGTLTEDALLEDKRHNYLASLVRLPAQDEIAIAWLDISTGGFAVCAVTPDTLHAELARLEPGEIVVPDMLTQDEPFAELLKENRWPFTPLAASYFDSLNAQKHLEDHFAVAVLDGFGEFSRAEIAACGALLDYVSSTQAGRLPALNPPCRHDTARIMLIDAATRGNLELMRTISAERRGSLLSVIDRTMTGAGGRLLGERLSAPLTDADAINARLDAVGFFLDFGALRVELRHKLARCPEFSRALSRLSVARGSPRDLDAIGKGLAIAAEVSHDLSGETGLISPPKEIEHLLETFKRSDATLYTEILQTLDETPPANARDGGFVRSGVCAGLDEQRALRDGNRKVIAGLQARYADETAIKTLKIRHNNVLGFFVEVPAQHAGKLKTAPHRENFIHRQSLANAVRFTTAQLTNLESRIALAAERALAFEMRIFDALVERVCGQAAEISATVDALAALDVATALADLAEKERYVRPHIDDSRRFEIVGGRHPVVERALRCDAEGSFVANDCTLTAYDAAKAQQSGRGRHIWLVTGPNMAGKSTFLRQNALIAILAQTGCYVPATSAHIGVVDRLFCRVGAADDLARGRSTFMVEMVETATILHQAGDRSLVILDEIGRGTATFDGLSIAWASVEHLHEVNRCRALFATHFHELTALAGKLDGLANMSMAVREWQGEPVFLHEVAAGAADRSYGIQVARLSGLPHAVVERAGEVLRVLEQGEQTAMRRELVGDLPLFSAARPRSGPAASPEAAKIEAALASVLPDQLTPREALELVYRLKALASGNDT